MTTLPNGVEIEVIEEFYSLEDDIGAEHSALGGCTFTSSGYIQHKAFFCSTCGLIWARTWVTVEGEYAASHDCVTKQCKTHGNGSLIDWSRPISYILNLPTALLRRELRIWQP